MSRLKYTWVDIFIYLWWFFFFFWGCAITFLFAFTCLFKNFANSAWRSGEIGILDIFQGTTLGCIIWNNVLVVCGDGTVSIDIALSLCAQWTRVPCALVPFPLCLFLWYLFFCSTFLAVMTDDFVSNLSSSTYANLLMLNLFQILNFSTVCAGF